MTLSSKCPDDLTCQKPMTLSSKCPDEHRLPMVPEEFASVLEALLDQVRRHATHEYARAQPNHHASTPESTDEAATEPLSWRSATNVACYVSQNSSCQLSKIPAGLDESHNVENVSGNASEDVITSSPIMCPNATELLNHSGDHTCPPRLVTRRSYFRDTVEAGSSQKKRLSMEDALNTDFNVQTSRWVISPDTNRFVQYWNLVAAASMAYVAIFSPVAVAMMDVQMNGWFVVNCLVDVIFTLDMILQFFMMYSVKTSFGNRLEHRHSVIMMHYLRTWFFIDLFAVFPFDLVALLVQSKEMQTGKTMKFIRVLRLLKMTRMLKASRMKQRLETQAVVSHEGLALNKFFMVLLLISHWLACAWALTLKLTEQDGVPQWVDSVHDQEENVEIRTKDSVWKLYMASLYFIAYTITSVGYGDITPKNILERIVCIVILFGSGIAWACVIGQVASIVGNMDAKDRQFRMLMDNLNCMVRDRGLPPTVSNRLRKFFLSAKQAQKNEQEEQIFQRMSPVLQGEVALSSNWHWVSRMKFMKQILPFADLSDVKNAPILVADIALSLKSATFAQSEVFGKSRVLYVLRKGLAVTRVGGWFHIESAGSVWGEDFVLSDVRLRDPAKRLALTYVEAFFLEYETFREVVLRHSYSNPELEHQVRSFTARLSARRAILTEARWRRFHERQKVSFVRSLSSRNVDGKRISQKRSNSSICQGRSVSSYDLSWHSGVGVTNHSISSISGDMRAPSKDGQDYGQQTLNGVSVSDINSMFRCDP